MPANLVFRRKIWGARDNGIPPRSTPGHCSITRKCAKFIQWHSLAGTHSVTGASLNHILIKILDISL